MSLLNNLLSSIDPSASTTSPAPSARQAQAQAVKRKAESISGSGPVKIQRKDAPTQMERANGPARPIAASDAIKAKPTSSATPMPYRGTAGLEPSSAAKTSQATSSRPGGALSKSAAAPASKLSTGTPPPPTNTTSQAKKGSYAAMLARAREVQAAKPLPPPIKHEATKILTKKERLALREQAKAGVKGVKASSVGPAARSAEVTGEQSKDKRKVADVGYQGTARPAKKPLELSYKGTARPIATSSGSAGVAPGASSAKAKSKLDQGRYSGYAEWSDLDDMDEEADGYDSGASSDMEGGVWDVEEEEQLALKTAKKEDLEALREENELKRQKEERKRKLMALSAAAKKKY